VLIPQQPDDIYFKKAFKENLKTKVSMTIINMPWQRTLAQVVKLAILVGNEMFIKRKNRVKYHQDFNVEKSYDFDEEDEH
jgi:hypothetical protein